MGDICYLKEPYGFGPNHDESVGKIDVVYRFNSDKITQKVFEGTRNNKLFMKAIYARYFVKITGVGVQLTQDISIPDSIAEGIEFLEENVMGESCYKIYGVEKGITNSPYFSFSTIWKFINKKAPNRWEDNPFVWVYDFELTEKPKT